jgi:hypothetical protein
MRLSRNLAAPILTASLAIVIAPAVAEKPAETLGGPVPIKITAMPIDFDREHPDRKIFGKLVFRGGLNLFGNSRFFGGYSGIVLDPSGRGLLVISDAGTWLRAKLDYDGRKLKGLSDARIGPILGRTGKPLARDRDRDSEGIALLSGDIAKGVAYISFEGNHRIERYPFDRDKFGPPDASLKLPPETRRMDGNRGVEGLALVAGGPLQGTMVVFSERLPDRGGNLKGWLIGGPTPGPIALKNIAGFDITDMAPLPDGGIVLLERRFRYSEGIKMRIRRIAANDLKPGAPIVGETLLQAEDNLNIDNMEGIAAHRSAAGETILTIISDDNFSPLQRTLLMQFAVADGKPVLAEPRAR